MLKKILFNNQETDFTDQDLPFLIHGGDGNGASLFSVSLIANLYAQGSKLLFLCGYHMARDEFEEQTNSLAESMLINNRTDIERALAQRVIFVRRETPELFHELVNALPDLSERVVFLKTLICSKPQFTRILPNSLN